MNSYDAFGLTYKTGISNLELEKIISKDGHYSFRYAKYVLKGRFELGELAMSESGYYSYDYARDVLRGRFRLGENWMNNNFNNYCDYLINAIRYNHE